MPFFFLCLFSFLLMFSLPAVRAQAQRTVRHTGVVTASLTAKHQPNFVRKFAENDTTYFKLQLDAEEMDLVLYRPHNFGLADPRADFYVGHVYGNSQDRVSVKVTDRNFSLWYARDGAPQKIGPYEEMENDLREQIGNLGKEVSLKHADVGRWLKRTGNYGVLDQQDFQAALQEMAPEQRGEMHCGNAHAHVDPANENPVPPAHKLTTIDSIPNKWIGKRHVKVKIWVYDDSFGGRSNVEHVILDALSANHSDASNHWLLQDLYVLLSWEHPDGGSAQLRNEIPWINDAPEFLRRFKNWVNANSYARTDEIHMLATEHSWNGATVLGRAYIGTFAPDQLGNSHATGIACDDFHTTMAHEISHVLGVDHTPTWSHATWDAWWHVDLMYYTETVLFAKKHPYHHYNSSFTAINHSLRKSGKYPDKTINLGVINGMDRNYSVSGSTIGETLADHLGRVYRAPNKVYRFQVSIPGNYGFDIQNADWDTYLYILNGSTGDLITRDDDGGPGLLSRTGWVYLHPGVDYVAVVSGAGNTRGYYGNFIIWSQTGLNNSGKNLPGQSDGLTIPPAESTSDHGYSQEKQNVESGKGELKVELFPNPASEYAYLSLSGAGSEKIGQIQVADQLGRTVLTRSRNGNGVIKLRVNALPSGIYFINLLDGQGNLVRSQKLLRR